jgi:hypothetical protein
MSNLLEKDAKQWERLRAFFLGGDMMQTVLQDVMENASILLKNYKISLY